MSSRFQPRIFPYNPSKNVPDNVKSQLFLELKTGDIDAIKKYILKTGIKLNVVEKDTGDTVTHIILGLDDKIANNETKLNILEYLVDNGAPLEIPNNQNVWPIHLAAQLQDENILDFMIKHKVNTYRLDSSNNTPLHLSISGKEVSCPVQTEIKSLVPSQKIDKKNLNTTIDDVNKEILKLISTAPIKDDMVHIIKTIETLPEIYEQSDLHKNLQKDLINVFVNTGIDQNYTGDIDKQQIQISQIIDNTYAQIMDDTTMRGVTNPIQITPNNTGWSPYPAPNNIQKILPNTTDNLISDIREKISLQESNIIDPINNYITELYTTISKNIYTTDRKFITDLILDEKYGRDLTMIKFFYFMATYYTYNNIGESITMKILNNFKMISNNQYTIEYNNARNNVTMPPVPVKVVLPVPNFLYVKSYMLGEAGKDQNSVDDPNIPGFVKQLDVLNLLNAEEKLFANIFVNADIYVAKLSKIYFQEWFDLNIKISYIDIKKELMDTAITKIPRINKYVENIIQKLDKTNQNKIKNKSFIDILQEIIGEIKPIQSVTTTVANNYRNYDNTDFFLFEVSPLTLASGGLRFTPTGSGVAFSTASNLKFKLMEPEKIPYYKYLPSGGVPPDYLVSYYPYRKLPHTGPLAAVGDFDSADTYRFIDYFRTFDYIEQFLLNKKSGIVGYDLKVDNLPEILKLNVAEWDTYADNFKINSGHDNEIFYALQKIFYKYAQDHIYNYFMRLYNLYEERKLNLLFDAGKESLDTALAAAKILIPATVIPDIVGTNIIEKSKSLIKNYDDTGYDIDGVGPVDTISGTLLDYSNFINTFKDQTDTIFTALISPEVYNIKTIDDFINATDKWTKDVPWSRLQIMFANLLKNNNDLYKLVSRFSTDIITYNAFDYAKINTDLKKELVKFINLPENYYETFGAIGNDKFVNIFNEYVKTEIFDKYLNIYIASPTITFRGLNLLNIEGMPNIKDLNDMYDLDNAIFVFIFRTVRKIVDNLSIMDKITSDITKSIVQKSYYNVIQIYLPVFVKYSIIIIEKLLEMRKLLDDIKRLGKPNLYLGDETDGDPMININNMNNLINSFSDTNMKFINECFKKISNIDYFHNNIVDFFNGKSSRELAIGNSSTPKDQIFTAPLPRINTFPKSMPATDSLQIYFDILNEYKINNDVTYHSLANDYYGHEFFTYGTDGTTDFVQTYRSSDLTRTGPQPSKFIAIPTTANVQSNLISDNAALTGDYFKTARNFYREVDPIRGRIFDIGAKASDIKFSTGFIGYDKLPYKIVWTDGMPPAIKDLMADHLKISKQSIIEKIIQYVFDNRTTPGSTSEHIYNELNKLAVGDAYDNVNDIKIYTVIGKLADKDINNYIEYVTKNVISKWINDNIQTAYPNSQLINPSNSNLNIFTEKEFMAISLKDINKSTVDDLLAHGINNVEYKMLQIEPDPSNIQYVSNQQTEFVHYLYKINYSSGSKLSSNKTCYKIIPEVVSKLINSSSINSKNSDGDTPLHHAIEMQNADIVTELIKLGANKDGYVNNNGYTPLDLALLNIKNHIMYSLGSNVELSINNFVLPFNDLLMSRLKEERFGNNIIKNINLGIPIMIIMYNHMFNSYMYNYRYDLDLDTKEKITNMIRKYKTKIPSTIYPTELFTIINETDMNIILADKNENDAVKKSFNKSNKKKIDTINKSIQTVSNQIDNLKLELNKTNDVEQKKFINELITKLDFDRTDLETKLTNQQFVPSNTVNNDLYLVYKISVDNLIRKSNRTFDILEFYDLGFKEIGSNQNTNINVWKMYMNKPIEYAPDLIFTQINELLLIIINRNQNKISEHLDLEKKYINRITSTVKYDPTPKPLQPLNIIVQARSYIEPQPFTPVLKSELKTIINFLSKVKAYIDLKNNLPSELDDNPLLKEEVNHIIYIINLIITPVAKDIIISTIYNSFKEMDELNSIVTDTNDTISSIINANFNGQTVESFLQNILPSKAVHYFGNLYLSSNDPDKKIITETEIFNPIYAIIKANTIMTITDDSLLIKNIREYIVPFLSNTYKNFINILRLSIFSYEKYILNTYQLALMCDDLM